MCLFFQTDYNSKEVLQLLTERKEVIFSFKIRPQGYYFFRSKNYPIFKIPTDKVNVTKFEWKSQIKPWEKARSLTSTTTIEKGQYYRELSVRQTHRVVLEPAFETSLESFVPFPKSDNLLLFKIILVWFINCQNCWNLHCVKS